MIIERNQPVSARLIGWWRIIIVASLQSVRPEAIVFSRGHLTRKKAEHATTRTKDYLILTSTMIIIVVSGFNVLWRVRSH